MNTMGFNRYENYPGESYEKVASGSSSQHHERHSINIGLEARVNDRVNPILEKYARLLGVSDPLRLVLPEDYKGVLDAFSGDGSEGSIYRLFLDQLHDKYDSWSRRVDVNGKSFQFKPHKNFEVRGTIIELGTINDFDYYFVKVSEVKR